MRKDGKFIVNGDIPEGQASVQGLLSECFELAYELRTDAEKEDEDDDEQDKEEKNPVEDGESLADVLHAVCDGLTLLADLDDLADHLVKAYVAVGIGVDRGGLAKLTRAKSRSGVCSECAAETARCSR